MNKGQAKNLSIIKWTYLSEHPECRCNNDMPEEIRKPLKSFPAECPLCQLFIEERRELTKCERCPLSDGKEDGNLYCKKDGSLYIEWFLTEDEGKRGNLAHQILSEISNWNTEKII